MGLPLKADILIDAFRYGMIYASALRSADLVSLLSCKVLRVGWSHSLMVGWSHSLMLFD